MRPGVGRTVNLFRTINTVDGVVLVQQRSVQVETFPLSRFPKIT